MTIAQAVILGVVQGLTEFLPVSSTAHLVITQNLFGLQGPILLIFDVVVHVGTLLSLFVYFGWEFFGQKRGQVLSPSPFSSPPEGGEGRGEGVKVLLMIGPEGGFSDHEAKFAQTKGAKLITMGSEILRTDTAFVAAAGFFKLMGQG